MYGFDGQLFHIGMRVADIDVAMRSHTEAHGVRWASVEDRVMTIWMPGEGHVSVPVKIVYSVQGPVHLELLQGAAGSIWAADDTPGPHHLGYWVDDVTAETERLIAQGWTVAMASDSPENGYGRFSYVRSPAGVLIEPVSIASKPRFERWWAGGSLTDPISA